MNLIQCELHFLMRTHGKGSDKTVTVTSKSDHTQHQLIPLFGKEAFQLLLMKTAKPPAIVNVKVAGTTPAKTDFESGALVQVKEYLGPGYNIDTATPPINSRWNNQTKTWEIIPPGAPSDAYGYVITDEATKFPIETTVAVGEQTLFVDFVAMLQKVQGA